jgi:hypothetical protein
MSLQEYRTLLVRSNRALGTMLQEKKLVTTEQLDEANEKLLENIQTGDARRASILHILLFEMQVLNEDAYMEAVAERHAVGMIDLHSCQFRKTADLHFDLTASWVTWTVPFDMVDDFCMLATAFYSSPPAVKFWQEKYAGRNLVWYSASVRSLQSALERLEHAKVDDTPKSVAAQKTSSATKSPLKLADPTRSTHAPFPQKSSQAPFPPKSMQKPFHTGHTRSPIKFNSLDQG